MNKKWNFLGVAPTIGAAFILLIVFLWAFCFGPEITLKQDTSGFSRQADLLIEDNFSFKEYLDNWKSSGAFMYFAFIAIIAIFKLLMADKWYMGILFLNVTSICLTSYIIFILVKNVTMSKSTLLFSILLSAFSIDFLIRSRLILTDASYMFFAFCVFSLIICFCISEKNIKQIFYLGSSIILASFILFYRPVTIVVFVFIIISFCEYMLFIKCIDKDLTLFFRFYAIALCSLSILIIVIFAVIMKEPSLWPLEIFSDYIDMMSKWYKAGITVTGRPVFPQRPETYLNTIVDYPDYLILILKKIAIFFQISVSTFSFPHKILKYIFYVPTYSLSIVALIFLFRRESRFSRRAKWTGWLAFQWIYLFTIYHSLTWIDYTWRYRLPCVPALIILASLGFYQIRTGLVKSKSVVMKAQGL